VEVQVCNTSSNRGSNLALFDKISKNGDGGGSEASFTILLVGIT